MVAAHEGLLFRVNQWARDQTKKRLGQIIRSHGEGLLHALLASETVEGPVSGDFFSGDRLWNSP